MLSGSLQTMIGSDGKCRTIAGPATVFSMDDTDFFVFFMVSIGFCYFLGYINIYLYFSLFCLDRAKLVVVCATVVHLLKFFR